jgi:cytochrome c-type biogenesis protein CcmH
MKASCLAIPSLLVASFLSWAANAVEPGEALADPALEQRARGLSQELRCLVCQNQSIDDSEAPLARDLRRLVRERLTKGDDDAAVLRFVTERYGSFVRLRPPFEPATWALWLGPFAVLLGGGAVVLWRLRSQRPAAAEPLSEDEQRRLAALLREGDDG